MEDHKLKNIPTLQSYIVGFALSILLTLAAFGLAYIHISNDHEVISHEFLRTVLPLTALTQFIVQAIFFLHLSHRAEERSQLVTLIFMVVIVVLIAGGSLWIMQNLNSTMSPEQVAKYMHNEN